MFRQVVGSMFSLMARYDRVWRNVHGSQPVPITGVMPDVVPEPVNVSVERLWQNFQAGHRHFATLWRDVLTAESAEAVERLAGSEMMHAALEPRDWAHIVYDFASTYHRWSRDRFKLVETMTPLYYGRIAAFVNQTVNMTTAEVERDVVEHQAEVFEAEKPYLLARIDAWQAVTSPA
jgi:hypothetical protein